MTQVVVDEAGDEPVTVVITGVPTQQQALLRFGAGLVEQFRLQLGLQELIRLT